MFLSIVSNEEKTEKGDEEGGGVRVIKRLVLNGEKGET